MPPNIQGNSPRFQPQIDANPISAQSSIQQNSESSRTGNLQGVPVRVGDGQTNTSAKTALERISGFFHALATDIKNFFEALLGMSKPSAPAMPPQDPHPFQQKTQLETATQSPQGPTFPTESPAAAAAAAAAASQAKPPEVPAPQTEPQAQPTSSAEAPKAATSTEASQSATAASQSAPKSAMELFMAEIKEEDLPFLREQLAARDAAKAAPQQSASIPMAPPMDVPDAPPMAPSMAPPMTPSTRTWAGRSQQPASRPARPASPQDELFKAIHSGAKLKPASERTVSPPRSGVPEQPPSLMDLMKTSMEKRQAAMGKKDNE